MRRRILKDSFLWAGRISVELSYYRSSYDCPIEALLLQWSVIPGHFRSRRDESRRRATTSYRRHLSNAPFGINIEVELGAGGTRHVESSVFSDSITKALRTSLSVVISAIVFLAVHT